VKRRSFLRWLGLAPIVGPAVVKASGEPWRITATYVRTLPFTPAATATIEGAANTLTIETLRRAAAILNAQDVPRAERWLYSTDGRLIGPELR
jgi:hypothetical protein